MFTIITAAVGAGECANDVEDAVAVLRHAGRNVTKQVPAAEIETSRLDEALSSKPC